MKTSFTLLLLSGLLAASVSARSPHREAVSFQSVSNTGLGRSLYVVGSHPDLGSWNPVLAHRLSYTDGNVWTGSVAVQSGTALAYKYISRSELSSLHCDESNAHWMGGADLLAEVPAQPDAPYAGKTVYYHSGWTSAYLIVVQGTNGSLVPLERVGAGRAPGEYLYRGTGLGEAGEPFQFVPTGYLNGTQYYDNVQGSPYGGGDYYTPLDFLFVQDGQVFSYRPPAAPSPPTIVTTFVNSGWAPEVPGRNVRIYLPRGYAQNTWKRYPVLYLHDGQNVFRPGGEYGCWFAEDAADREMGQGRAREAILVAVDMANRFTEYCPPGDSVSGNPAYGDRYANFLIHNVRPTIDAHYRTLNGPANTLVLGSSLGGLISTYLGLRTNVFGGIGALSPSYWTAPVFRGWIVSNATAGIRFYLDWGVEEGSSMWDYGWPVRDALLRDGYVEGSTLKTILGCGHDHNEAAWADRFPGALRYLLDPWDEANALALEAYQFDLKGVTNGVGAFGGFLDTLSGRTYVLETASSLSAGALWTPVSTVAIESLPWSQRSFSVTGAVAPGSYFRAVLR